MALPKIKYSNDVYEVGGKIREAREVAGLTQEQLAERSNISGNAISRYETGESEMRIGTLFKIADGLGISPEELMPERFFDEVTEVKEITRLLFSMNETDRSVIMHMIRRLSI